jgi:hypothetical protein
MKRYRVECGALVERGVLEIDLPTVCAALLRETGACSVNVIDETAQPFDPQL